MDVKRMTEMTEIKKRLDRLTKELGKYEDPDDPKEHTAEEIERTDAVRKEIARLNTELEELGRS
jgi:ribosomal protein L29